MKGQGAGLLQQPSWESDLPDVVYEPAEVCQLLLSDRQSHPSSNVTCVHSDCCGVPRRISISRVKRRNKCRGERQAGSFELLIHSDKIVRQAPLLLVHDEEPLRRKSRYEKECERPRRKFAIGDRQNRNEGCVESYEPQSHGNKRPCGLCPPPVAPKFVDHRGERNVECFPR